MNISSTNYTDQRELLSSHDTIAIFSGIEDKPCYFRTSLCPNQCNHGGKIAKFTIKNYNNYEKLNQYGDEKVTIFHVKLSDINNIMVEKIQSLKPGMQVHLCWNHDYITRICNTGEESKFPDRPLLSIELLE